MWIVVIFIKNDHFGLDRLGMTEYVDREEKLFTRDCSSAAP